MPNTSSNLPENLQSLLALYPEDVARDVFASEVVAQEISNGFSGARLWQLESARGPLCLRRWPIGHPDSERLEWLGRVLLHAFECGCEVVPVPFRARDQKRHVTHQGHLWELAPWMPGEAVDREAIDPDQLRAGLAALATFHLAMEQFTWAPGQPDRAPPPGVCSRLETLRGWTDRRLDQLHRAVATTSGRFADALRERGEAIIALYGESAAEVEHLLEVASRTEVELIPCIRDIHAEHVLFQEKRVSGIVDFGSLRYDHPATDIARLLGDWAADDLELWDLGLAAYEQARPLADHDRMLIPMADRSAVLLSGMVWLEWVYFEGRQFERESAVLRRIDAILSRLRHVP